MNIFSAQSTKMVMCKFLFRLAIWSLATSTTAKMRFGCRFKSNSLDRSAFTTNDEVFRWRNPRNTIPYFFDKAVGEVVRERVQDAMTSMSKNTCIGFKKVQKKNAPAHPLEIFNENSHTNCDAYENTGFVSSEGRKVIMSFTHRFCSSYNYSDFNLVMHELGHVVGLEHTHSWPDRDKFINVHRECIKEFDDAFDRFDESDKVQTCQVPSATP